MLNKKAQSKGNMGVILVVALVALYLFSTGTFTKGPAAPTGTTPGAVQVGACSLDTAPTIGVSSFDFYDKSTTLSPTFRFWVDGVQSSDTSSPFDSVVGQPYTILANDTGYYTAVLVGQTKCQPNEPVEMKGYDATVPTVTFYNSDDQPATAQAIGVDEVKTVSIKLAAANDDCYGNPQALSLVDDANTVSNPNAGIVVGFDYNTSQIDKVELAGAVKIGVPQQSVGTLEEAYRLSYSSLCDLAEQRHNIVVEADSVVNPTQDVTGTIFDPDVFVESKTGKITAGVENIDGVDQGTTNPTFTIDLS